MTIDGRPMPWASLFVVATQNPIEQEGTYRLPETSARSFLFKIEVGYPGNSDEKQMLRIISAHGGA
ncbi:MAG: AAA family ATPase [Bacteroidia bacterium]